MTLDLYQLRYVAVLRLVLLGNVRSLWFRACMDSVLPNLMLVSMRLCDVAVADRMDR